MSVRRSAMQLNSSFLGELQSCSTPGRDAEAAVLWVAAAVPAAAWAAGKPRTATAAAVNAASRAEVLRAAGLDWIDVRNV